MVIHPVRLNGVVIGAPQTYDYFKQMQERIVKFVTTHSKITKEKYEELMMSTGMMTKDLGTIVEGNRAVEVGLIDEVGGISDAVSKLRELMTLLKEKKIVE